MQVQISKEIAPESVSVDLKISIPKPIHVKWVNQYYDHIRTNKEIIKNGWCIFGITKAIKKNIHKEDKLKNYIVLDLNFYRHDFKKKSFDSSLIFIKFYEFVFVKLSLSFAN